MTNKQKNMQINAYLATGASDRFLYMACIALMILSVFLRLTRYVSNPAIWLDEAMLLDNLFDLSLLDLLGPLYHEQAAPWGFLLLTRFAMYTFGITEYALRILPFLTSCASACLLFLVAKRQLPLAGTCVALALFALSPPFIYYAAELKPYASDAAIALALYALAFHTSSHQTRPQWIALAVAGTFAPWFSLPSVFILFGIGIALAAQTLAKRPYSQLFSLAGLGCIWASSFCLYYILSLRHTSANPALREWWSHAYMPFPPISPTALRWLVHTSTQLLEEHTGRLVPPISLLLCLLGICDLARRTPAFTIAAILPWIAALATSAFGRYPFSGRFLLFIAPTLFIFIGAGVNGLLSHIHTRFSKPFRNTSPKNRTIRNAAHILTALCLALLFTGPAIQLPQTMRHTPRDIGIRPQMRYLADHLQPNDWIYVQYWAHYPFRYYARRYALPLDTYTAGITSRADWTKYEHDLQRIKNHPQVWVLLHEVDPRLSAGEMKYIEQLFHKKGKTLAEIHSPNSTLLLYDMEM